MPRYTAVLDACVLVPIALADTLLRVAEKGLYRPLWSDRILAEAQAATEEIHPGIDASKRFAQMREAFDDALVTGWEELEGGLSLPDQDDRHVVAAAIRGGAQGIITANAKDFPAPSLEPLGLEAVHPDDSNSSDRREEKEEAAPECLRPREARRRREVISERTCHVNGAGRSSAGITRTRRTGRGSVTARRSAGNSTSTTGTGCGNSASCARAARSRGSRAGVPPGERPSG
jgi:PIN domain-containing protein